MKRLLGFGKNFDWFLAGSVVALLGLGILVLFATAFKASGVAAPVDARNQVIFAILGVVVLVVLARVDYRAWARFSTWFYLITLVLLGAVMLFGKTALGATRWINLGFFQFQPSELAKIMLVLVLAKFLSSHYDEMDQPKFLLLSLFYTLVPVFLVLAQPDLGTAMILMLVWVTMVSVSKVKKSHLLILIAVGIALLPIGLTTLKPYQKERLATFLHPTANPLGSGYNVVQAQIAVGSGQVFGRGLSAGSQSQLNFLPSQQTDFIFAVLAEKLGFVGALVVLSLFLILLIRAVLTAYKAQDRFGLFLAVGITALFLFHVLINVGMNLGIMPVTGIPLPFISYGGTSLLISLVAIGLLESINLRHQKIRFGH